MAEEARRRNRHNPLSCGPVLFPRNGEEGERETSAVSSLEEEMKVAEAMGITATLSALSNGHAKCRGSARGIRGTPEGKDEECSLSWHQERFFAWFQEICAKTILIPGSMNGKEALNLACL